MKVRSRAFKKVKADDSNKNPWNSFVDLMSVVSLVFFFIMLIILTAFTKMKSDYEDIAKSRDELYIKVGQILEESLDGQGRYIQEEGRVDINSEALFDLGSKELKAEGIVLADKVGNAFNKILSDDSIREKIKSVKITGHTDGKMDAAYNRSLSAERAASFVNQMLKDNINNYQYGQYFEVSGMSEYKPKNPEDINNVDREKAEDRRIEIEIVFDNTDLENIISKYAELNK